MGRCSAVLPDDTSASLPRVQSLCRGSPRARPRVLIVTAVIAAVLPVLTALVARAQTARVLILPESIVLAPGGSAVLEVWIQDVADLYGADLCFSFSPAQLQVEDVDPEAPGVQIAGGSLFNPAYAFQARNTAVNETGSISYTVALMNPAPAVNGGGVVARIAFRAIGAGATEVRFTRAVLSNRLAQPIQAAVSGANVIVGGATVTVQPSRTPTRTRTPTVTPTGAPSPTPTPALEEVVLQDSARRLGWPPEVVRQPPLYSIAYVVEPGHTGQAWLQRYSREEDARLAFLQQRDALMRGGWVVRPVPFHGHDAYVASHAMSAAADLSPAGERVAAFQASGFVVRSSALDETASAIAPDPLAVAEEVYQAGSRYHLFGGVVPSAFLPIVIREYPPRPTATPSATATASATATEVPSATPSPSATSTPTATATDGPSTTPSATPTGTLTPLATYTATPSATITMSATPTATGTQTPVVTASATPSATSSATATPVTTATISPTATTHPTPTLTPIVRQLLQNSGFEDHSGWDILQTAYPAGYSVSRAFSGQRSMRLGIDTGPNIYSFSSVQQTVDIPAGVRSVDLHFHYFPVAPQADGDRIYLIVLRASDGVGLLSRFWTDQRQTWNQRSEDLSGLAGQRVIIRFGVKNDGLGGVMAVYLDDAELIVAGFE